MPCHAIVLDTTGTTHARQQAVAREIELYRYITCSLQIYRTSTKSSTSYQTQNEHIPGTVYFKEEFFDTVKTSSIPININSRLFYAVPGIFFVMPLTIAARLVQTLFRSKMFES